MWGSLVVVGTTYFSHVMLAQHRLQVKPLLGYSLQSILHIQFVEAAEF
jgi:hypothetical protein